MMDRGPIVERGTHEQLSEGRSEGYIFSTYFPFAPTIDGWSGFAPGEAWHDRVREVMPTPRWIHTRLWVSGALIPNPAGSCYPVPSERSRMGMWSTRFIMAFTQYNQKSACICGSAEKKETKLQKRICSCLFLRRLNGRSFLRSLCFLSLLRLGILFELFELFLLLFFPFLFQFLLTFLVLIIYLSQVDILSYSWIGWTCWNIIAPVVSGIWGEEKLGVAFRLFP